MKPDKGNKSVITRRQLLLCASAGVLTLTAGTWLSRRAKAVARMDGLEIVLEGPFSAEVWGPFIDLREHANEFVYPMLLDIGSEIGDGAETPAEYLSIVYGFEGPVAPNRQIRLTVTLYGGAEPAEFVMTDEDPRLHSDDVRINVLFRSTEDVDRCVELSPGTAAQTTAIVLRFEEVYQ